MPAKRRKNLHPEVVAFLAKNGAKGGAAGTGDSKRRGDSEYYRKIRNGKPLTEEPKP